MVYLMTYSFFKLNEKGYALIFNGVLNDLFISEIEWEELRPYIQWFIIFFNDKNKLFCTKKYLIKNQKTVLILII